MLASFLSVATGFLIAHTGFLILIVLLALPVASWIALSHPGAALGALWLVALNGIPLIDLQSGAGQLRPTDLAVFAMVLIAAGRLLLGPRTIRRLPISVAGACGLFGLWWFLTLFRSLEAGIPTTDALFFGRDFLSFIVVIPAAWIVFQARDAWRECVIVVVVGAAVYSLFYVAGALGLVNAVSFTHPQLISSAGAIQRLYTPMNDLVVTVAVFAGAVLATTRRSRLTPWIASLAAITLLAFLLQLTRAAYLGMAVGGMIAILIAITRGPQIRKVLFRRVTVFVVVTGMALIIVTGVGSTSLPTNVITGRISSGFTDLGERSGTVRYRLNLYHRMLGVLGPDWPVGLTFLHPKDRYFPDLPDGTIRNADVGLLNAVMTMGLTGLVLLLCVPLVLARYVMQTRKRRPPWMIVGFFAWLAVLLAGLPTLITLFSPTGLVSTGLTLALCATTTTARRQERNARSG
ncbi:MAG TPA: O-antigen ligase family protein [Solirubrobacteraceae bacterium]|nr:O-antigen ligase family protein [Solirubrobacteraceae bacterium]